MKLAREKGQSHTQPQGCHVCLRKEKTFVLHNATRGLGDEDATARAVRLHRTFGIDGEIPSWARCGG